MSVELTGPVVVGVDGSPAAVTALRWAADEAALRELPLKIVYVSEDPGPRLGDGEAQTALSSAGHRVTEHAMTEVRAMRPDITLTSEVLRDDPAHGLIKESESAALVVVGSRGHGGFHDLMLGSTSLQVSMHARSAVAVVRPPAAPEQAGIGAVGRIVVGVDGSPQSGAALAFAFDEADRRGCGITAVHAWLGPVTTGAAGMPFVYDVDTLREQEETVLATAVAGWHDRYPHVELERITMESSAAAALTEQSMGAQLVVVGCRGLGGFTGLLLGSVSQALIHHAGCPVVVAHLRGEAGE
ncbi:universal stress protein [Catellatospora citrea]|uniref:Universal stress protein n=1 Tax=Catellatospora citrea TaxID=53366 RepID=A0A8J3KL16_9ACTN|nr:universal stress protein [Catellatospora citrea]RKE06459.1 nucleotide-binding universal stress UspA family protein [Catellatospora citrea]GIG01762.1 universal stress protein [Catellatospora citrea]